MVVSGGRRSWPATTLIRCPLPIRPLRKAEFLQQRTRKHAKAPGDEGTSVLWLGLRRHEPHAEKRNIPSGARRRSFQSPFSKPPIVFCPYTRIQIVNAFIIGYAALLHRRRRRHHPPPPPPLPPRAAGHYRDSSFAVIEVSGLPLHPAPLPRLGSDTMRCVSRRVGATRLARSSLSITARRFSGVPRNSHFVSGGLCRSVCSHYGANAKGTAGVSRARCRSAREWGSGGQVV